ncbi:MAG: SGNH/GDSL hydrolase family protein [Planctomycetes bacterium]|nr:SGNH/GDSL hydrolase family protein [Planctomycetota bacterium]
MNSSKSARTLAALYGAAVALAVCALALRWRSRETSIDLQIETPAPSRAGSSSGPASTPCPSRGADAGAESGIPALQALNPRFPPSTFVRGPWRDEGSTDRAAAVVPNEFSGSAFRGALDRNKNFPEHPDGRYRLKTNALGLRNDAEVLAGRPELRVLVIGDSHTAGYCNNAEAYPHLLELALGAANPGARIEVLNSGVPGFTFWNYLGALERFATLEPDVAVITVYGGNDFVEVLGYHHAFHGTPRGDLAALEARAEPGNALSMDAMSQAFLAHLQFALDPAQIDCALQSARDVTTEIVVTCLRRSIRPVFVYLPAQTDLQWDERADTFADMCRVLELRREDCRALDSMAQSYFAFLRQTGVEVLDLREPLRRAQGKLYWRSDFHLAPAGHAAVARELAPVLARVAPLPLERVRPGAAPPPAPRTPGARDE